MIHPGVALSKISNVSFSFSNSNVTSSISCSASLRELVKYCIDNNHKNATITCKVHMDDPSFCYLTHFMVSRFFDTAKIHSCSFIFTFCVNVDALYMHLISREHTVNSNCLYSDTLSYTFALHVQEYIRESIQLRVLLYK